MRVSFTVPGEPKGKQRPQFSRMGKFVRAYTPQQTVSYENLVKMAYCTDGEPIKLQGAISACIDAFFSIPKSASKKKHEQMVQQQIRPITTRIDSDNICKIVLDALNGIAYDDDRQVVDIEVHKYYSENPRTRVVLTELDGFNEFMNPPEVE